MFFIIATSTDGGKTWQDDFETKYDGGAEAQLKAKEQNERYTTLHKRYPNNGYNVFRWRVRKVLDTDNDNFYAREAAKNHKPFDFAEKGGDSVDSWNIYEYTLPHYDPNDKRKVRFFSCIEDAIEGKYTSTSISRFIANRYDASDTVIEKFLVEIGYYDGEYQFAITQDADEIQTIYENGPSSCMNDPREYPLPELHPTRVYAGPDLGVAYISRNGDFTARAVVWPDKKIYVGIYGHCSLLRAELEKAGYTRNHHFSMWEGARLQKIKEYPDDEGEYIMPYLDFGEAVVDSGDFWIVKASHEDGSLYARNCTGFVGE